MAKEIRSTNGVIELDNGEKLYSPTDFNSARGLIYDSAEKAMAEHFGFEHGGIKVDVTDLSYADPADISIDDERNSLLTNKMLSRRLRGNVRLFKDGELLEEKKVTLMNVPHLTDRGTFIHGGNDYGRISQARLLPGAYTRIKATGEVENQINPKTGTGRSMRLALDPETANYHLEVGGKRIHFYSLLKALGEPDASISKMWGSDVLAKNATKSDKRALVSAYESIVKTSNRTKDANSEQMIAGVRSALDGMLLNKHVVETTLPGIVGGHVKRAYDESVHEAGRLIARNQFEPDEELTKLAAAEADAFDPDLSGDEMQDAHESIHSKTKPMLANSKAWPSKWMPPGSNELGWIDWYQQYANGRRTADDERQMKRWRLFKARHGAAFVKNPTARAAYALRYWAIDPMKLLEGKTNAQAKLLKEMREHEEKVTKQFEEYGD